MKFRFDVTSFIMFAGMFLVELMIALFVRDSFVRPFVGDVLVVVLIYLFIRVFLECRKVPLVAGVLVFAWAIEVGQYFNLVSIIGLQEFRVARVVIGSTFDVMDLLAYSAGAFLLILPEMQFLKRKKGELTDI